MNAPTDIAMPAADTEKSATDLEWLLRPFFGVVLALTALAAMVYGGVWFALFIAAGTIAGVREWHRMMRKGGYLHYVFVSGAGLAGAVAAIALHLPPVWPLAILGAAALADLVIGLATKTGAWWQAFGPLYLGIPGIALFALRDMPVHGLAVTLTLFMAVWATDTGAMMAGKRAENGAGAFAQ